MTQQQNPFSSFKANEFFKNFSALSKNNPFDPSKFLEFQRKNMETLSEAQQITADAFQEIVNKQIEIVSQLMEEQSFITNQLLREGTPEDKLTRNAELIKNSYEKAITGAKEISDLVKKTNTKATGLLNKRATASFKEIKETVNKSSHAA